jgi:hypothetical protein
MGIKYPLFFADFKMEQFTFVNSPYQKLEPKYSFQKKKSGVVAPTFYRASYEIKVPKFEISVISGIF